MARRPPPLEHPPFPRLRWDAFQWVGEAVFPTWAGFQARQGPYAGLSSEEPSDGTAHLCVNVPDEGDPTPPSAEQAAAFRHLLDHGEAVRDAVLAAVFDDYGSARRNAFPGAELDEAMPEIDRPEQLAGLMGVGTVFILTTAAEGFAYVGFEFGCTWDEEHGFGVLTHRGRVVEVGAAETAWDEALAEEDARRAR